MKFLKIELDGKQIDLIPVSDELALCDGCYGLIEFCEKSWKLKEEDSVDLVRELTTELLRQIKEGSAIASHDIFTGVIIDE
jgi:hypothetical protein